MSVHEVKACASASMIQHVLLGVYLPRQPKRAMLAGLFAMATTEFGLANCVRAQRMGCVMLAI